MFKKLLVIRQQQQRLLNRKNFDCCKKLSKYYSVSTQTNNLFHIEENVPQIKSELQRECVEIQIPVPWGFIRGKWWGPTDKRPILGPHGWQDNCGTFDRLAPLLPPDIGFLTLDTPGHGLSSIYPHGFKYSLYDMPTIMRKLAQEFEWKKISLLGHSLGSIQSFLYASLFPDDVDFYISIDIIMPLTEEENAHAPTVYASRIDRLLKYINLMMKGTEPPSYTYNECVTKFSEGTFHSVNEECAPYILNRGLHPSKNDPNKFYFIRDPRLKVGNLPSMSRDECFVLLSSLKCPTLLIRAKDSPYLGDSRYDEEICERLQKQTKDFQHIVLPGTHHLHLLSPDLVAEPMNAFIRKHDNEDRSQKVNLIDKLFIKRYH